MVHSGAADAKKAPDLIGGKSVRSLGRTEGEASDTHLHSKTVGILKIIVEDQRLQMLRLIGSKPVKVEVRRVLRGSQLHRHSLAAVHRENFGGRDGSHWSDKVRQ
jgi:hypothetical protein